MRDRPALDLPALAIRALLDFELPLRRKALYARCRLRTTYPCRPPLDETIMTTVLSALQHVPDGGHGEAPEITPEGRLSVKSYQGSPPIVKLHRGHSSILPE